MALSDWDIYKSDAGGGAAINVGDPIQAAGSLHLSRGTTASVYLYINLVSKGVTYQPVGVLRGALAGAFEIPGTYTNDASSFQYVGLCALQSQRDLTAGAGTCYALQLERRISTPALTLSLRHFTAGLVYAAQPAALWSQAITPIVALGTALTLELEWQAATELGGVRLIVRQGAALNYSDLVTLTDMIHSTTPPTSSLGEGPYMAQGATATINFNCLIDNWRLRT